MTTADIRAAMTQYARKQLQAVGEMNEGLPVEGAAAKILVLWTTCVLCTHPHPRGYLNYFYCPTCGMEVMAKEL